MVAERQIAISPDNVGRSLLSLLPKEQLEVLRKTIAPGASDAELEHFLAVADHNGLDPIADPVEVWMVPRRQNLAKRGEPENWVTKYQTMTSWFGALKAAKKKGVYHGHWIEYREADGRWYEDGDSPDESVAPVSCRCTLPVPGWERPIRFIARWHEFAQYKDGVPTEMWAKYGRLMLAKSALKNALKLLPDNPLDGMDLDEGGDFEPTRIAQGAFWAWADEQDITEPVVRRCLKVPDGESLGAAVERLGGWNVARSYVERLAPSVASLPAPTGLTAAETLYGEDQHRDPMEAAPAQASGQARASDSSPSSELRKQEADAKPDRKADMKPDIELYVCSACGRRTDEVRARETGGSVCKYCWEKDQDTAPIDDYAAWELGIGEATGEVIDAPTEPQRGPQDAAEPAIDAEPEEIPAPRDGAQLRDEATGVTTDDLELCALCGERPPDGFWDAIPACEQCLAAKQHPTTPAYPGGIHDLASFKQALMLHLDCGDVEARLRISSLGRINMRDAGEAKYRAWWDAACAAEVTVPQ
jgi:hypothetical protein